MYDRLTEETLLIRCLSQNANESLHSAIWSKCPKENFVSKQRVQLAASLAICEYNFGSTKTVQALMNQMNMPLGNSTLRITERRDMKRLEAGINKTTEKYKKSRRIIAQAKSNREQLLIEAEGVTFSAGMF